MYLFIFFSNISLINTIILFWKMKKSNWIHSYSHNILETSIYKINTLNFLSTFFNTYKNSKENVYKKDSIYVWLIDVRRAK